jgi:hypothetical protein
MTHFNDANELAYQLIYTRHYYDDEPCEPLSMITLWRGSERRVIKKPSREPNHKDWARIATQIDALLGEGWTIKKEQS